MDFDQVIERGNTNSLKWTRYGKAVLPLWVADMDFPAPQPVRDRLHEVIDHGVFGYEMPGKKLSETVVSRLQRLYGWTVDPEAVVATPGIVAGFHLAARAVCKPGNGILVQPPVYNPFLKLGEHTGTQIQLAQLQQRNLGPRVTYEIDWAAFESAFDSNGTRTAMFLLCHPHNPTGQIYTPAELKRMAEICLSRKVVICSDEIHSELLLGGARHAPLASLSPEIAAHTITLFSPSKTFNLVGLFCGFAVIPDAQLRRAFRRVMDQQAVHVNSLGLTAAAVAFSGPCEPWLCSLREYLTSNRDYLVDYVGGKLPNVKTTVPDATYLAWLDFGELVEQGKIKSSPYDFLLQEARVGLNPGADFGPGGQNFVRLNFGCPRSTLEEGLRRIEAALSRAGV